MSAHSAKQTTPPHQENIMNRINALASSSLIVALAFVAQACCGGLEKEEADQTLRVEINEGDLKDGNIVEPVENPTKLCGADVVAHGDDGSEVVLEEVEGINGGCEYVAQGDSDVAYTISATHPELGGGENAGETNPACSTPTPSEDIDSTLLVVRPNAQPRIAGAPR
jgi:hypothetical protein